MIRYRLSTATVAVPVALAAAAALCAAPARAAIIDFDAGVACGASACSPATPVSQAYDLPNLDLSFRAVASVGSSQTHTSIFQGQAVTVDFLTWWSPSASGNFGDLIGSAYASSGNGLPGTHAGEVRLDVAPGFTLTLHTADFAGFGRSATSQVSIFDLGYSLLFSSGSFTAPATGHATISLGNISSTAGLILHFGPEAYDVAIDNIAYTLAASAPGVPEPGTWALLIAGFGLTGAAMRRRAVVAA